MLWVRMFMSDDDEKKDGEGEVSEESLDEVLDEEEDSEDDLPEEEEKGWE